MAAYVNPGTPASSGAPPGVGPAPGTPHRPPRTGDRVSAGAICQHRNGAPNATGSVRLTGTDWTRRARCVGRLDDAAGAELARSLVSSCCTGARVMRESLGKPPRGPLPNHAADRTRAVMRWTRRILGVPAGILAARAAIRRHLARSSTARQ